MEIIIIDIHVLHLTNESNAENVLDDYLIWQGSKKERKGIKNEFTGIPHSIIMDIMSFLFVFYGSVFLIIMQMTCKFI